MRPAHPRPAVPSAGDGGREHLCDPPAFAALHRPLEIVAEDNLNALVNAHADRLEARCEGGDERRRVADVLRQEVAALHPRYLWAEHVRKEVELLLLRLDEACAVGPGRG